MVAEAVLKPVSRPASPCPPLSLSGDSDAEGRKGLSELRVPEESAFYLSVASVTTLAYSRTEFKEVQLLVVSYRPTFLGGFVE